jgi:hypothetical protein
MICPDCNGTALVDVPADGPHGGGSVRIRCGRCNGAGEVDPTRERWRAIGGMHRTRRVANRESIRDCALRLGIDVAALCDMENGRADPEVLAAATPPASRERGAA